MFRWPALLRYAARSLGRSPGFFLVTVLTLGLAVGANTAIFSVVRGVLLRPLPLPEPQRLVSLCEVHPSVAGYCVASPPDVADWSRSSRSLESVGLGRDWTFLLRGDEGSERLRGGLATPELFSTLGLRPALGRLSPPPDASAEEGFVVLSHRLWQQRFAADPGVLGRTLWLDGRPHAVLGVLAQGQRVPLLEEVEAWTPLPFDPRDEEQRGWRGFLAYGRLAPNADRAAVQRELAGLQERLATQHPDTNRGWGIDVVPLHERVVGAVRPALWLLYAAVSLVLLVACVNVANLSLARAAGRRRELAVRSSLGAGRGRLFALLLAEGSLLAAAGAACGLFLAVWLTDLFLHLAPPSLPRTDAIRLDDAVLAVTLAVTVAMALFFALVPALQIRRQAPLQELRGGRAGRDPATRHLHSALVVAQVALAVVLVAAAALVLQSFAGLLRWQPGFDTDRLLTVWLLSSQERYPQAAAVARHHAEVVAELRALPQVEEVGLASGGPLFGGREGGTFSPLDRPESEIAADWFDVGPGYFSALGLALVKGRGLLPSDRPGAPPVALVNETFARLAWPAQDAVGRRLVDERGGALTVVGVVRDVEPFRRGTPPAPEVYWPHAQRPRWGAFLVVRSRGETALAAREVRQRLRRLGDDDYVATARSMDDLVAAHLVRPGFETTLLGGFALLALLLASVGIAGLLAYSVAQRRHEIGVRMALGATPRVVRTSLVRRGLVLAAAGSLLGVALVLAAAPLLAHLLVGVSARDPLTLAGAVAFFLAAATLACDVPARRAGRTDPLLALRCD